MPVTPVLRLTGQEEAAPQVGNGACIAKPAFQVLAHPGPGEGLVGVCILTVDVG